MNERRRLVGFVKSNKMMKTVVVTINRTFRHPLYKKVVHTSHHVKAHDELGCQEGDQVQIVESRPLSREKRWVVEAILKHGRGLEVVEESAIEVEESAAEEVEESAAEEVEESAAEEVEEAAAEEVEETAEEVDQSVDEVDLATEGE
jgi:small subunit ribosomal protein S17